MTADNAILFQTDERLRLVEQEQTEMREVIFSLKESQQSISNSLERLVRLEERHVETREALTRAFTQIERHAQMIHEVRMQIPANLEERLRKIEQDMPGLIEMRRWVTAGVMSVVGLIGAGLIGLLISLPK